MKFVFFSTGRSFFDADSERLLAYPDVFTQLHETKPDSISAELWDAIDWVPQRNFRNDALVYERMDAHDTATVPFGMFHFGHCKMLDNMMRKALGDMPASVHDLANKVYVAEEESYVTVCDNTISVGVFVIKTTEPVNNELTNALHDIDSWSNEFCANIMRYVQLEVINPLSKAMHERCRDFGTKLIYAPDEYDDFVDICHIFDKGGYENAVAPILWVSRMFMFEEEDKQPHLLEYLREWSVQADDAIERIRLAGRGEVIRHTGWANNFIFGSTDLHHQGPVMVAFRRMNYINAVLDVMAKNLFTLYATISTNLRSREMSRIAGRVNRIVGYSKFFAAEVYDFMHSIQGETRFHAEHLYKVWGIQELTENALSKANITREKLSDFQQSQMSISQRRMDATIAFLGGIALVDFVVSLADFTFQNDDHNEDGIIGLTDLVRSSPPDLLITAVLSLVVIMAIYNYMRSGRI